MSYQKLCILILSMLFTISSFSANPKNSEKFKDKYIYFAWDHLAALDYVHVYPTSLPGLSSSYFKLSNDEFYFVVELCAAYKNETLCSLDDNGKWENGHLTLIPFRKNNNLEFSASESSIYSDLLDSRDFTQSTGRHYDLPRKQAGVYFKPNKKTLYSIERLDHIYKISITELKFLARKKKLIRKNEKPQYFLKVKFMKDQYSFLFFDTLMDFKWVNLKGLEKNHSISTRPEGVTHSLRFEHQSSEFRNKVAAQVFLWMD